MSCQMQHRTAILHLNRVGVIFGVDKGVLAGGQRSLRGIDADVGAFMALAEHGRAVSIESQNFSEWGLAGSMEF